MSNAKSKEIRNNYAPWGNEPFLVAQFQVPGNTSRSSSNENSTVILKNSFHKISQELYPTGPCCWTLVAGKSSNSSNSRHSAKTKKGGKSRETEATDGRGGKHCPTPDDHRVGVNAAAVVGARHVLPVLVLNKECNEMEPCGDFFDCVLTLQM